MSKIKVLYVTQELFPYTEDTFLSDLSKRIPNLVSSEDIELRIMMPKFGIINERRHRLHEVVRLSGMNIIVDDEDYPLIIKVATLQGARIQVYFLDNDEFFKRKAVYKDDNEKPFEDNQERITFFCKGVMETVKKFGWSPDIIHLNGQITSLMPLYTKVAYKNDPVFSDAKIIYSMYNNAMEGSFNERFKTIGAINDLEASDLNDYELDGEINVDFGAARYSDALIAGSDSYKDVAREYGEKLGIKVLQCSDDFEEAATEIVQFYKSLLDCEQEITPESKN